MSPFVYPLQAYIWLWFENCMMIHNVPLSCQGKSLFCFIVICTGMGKLQERKGVYSDICMIMSYDFNGLFYYM